MGWIVFILFFLIIGALLAFVIHIDYHLDNPTDHPQTEAEANVELLKMRYNQAVRKMKTEWDGSQ